MEIYAPFPPLCMFLTENSVNKCPTRGMTAHLQCLEEYFGTYFRIRLTVIQVGYDSRVKLNMWLTMYLSFNSTICSGLKRHNSGWMCKLITSVLKTVTFSYLGNIPSWKMSSNYEIHQVYPAVMEINWTTRKIATFNQAKSNYMMCWHDCWEVVVIRGAKPCTWNSISPLPTKWSRSQVGHNMRHDGLVKTMKAGKREG